MRRQISILVALLAGVTTLSAQQQRDPEEPGVGHDQQKDVIHSCDSNYVRTYTFTAAKARSYSIAQEHFDGLGRKSSTVQRNFSPDRRDVFSYVVYDSLGREWKTTLPSPEGTLASQSLYGENQPFSEIVYEASPLNRVSRQYGPGAKWKANGRYVSTTYYTNADSGDLACYRLANDSWNLHVEPFVEKLGLWPSGMLSVTQTKDESGSRVYEFKDKQDKVILTRKKLDGRNLDTYRVYDAKGRLVAVLPPLASAALASKSSLSSSSEEISRYAYLYQYDSRDRCIAKKLPGCGWTYYIYDKGDRLVFTQDAELRKEGKWMFSFSDAHGRPCLSGICRGSREGLTQAVSDSNLLAVRSEDTINLYRGYDLSISFSFDLDVLSVSYYDDYDFIDAEMPLNISRKMRYAGGYSGLASTGQGGEDFVDVPELDTGGMIGVIDEPVERVLIVDGQTNYVQGRLTGSAERILGEELTNDFKWSTYFYDRKGNVIESHTTRESGGVDVTATSVSFTGKPKSVRICHDYQGKGVYEEFYEYTYDNWDRPLKIRHRLEREGCSRAWTTLSNIQYDAAGRVVSDVRTGNPALLTAFTYNVRSWKTGITGPGFSEELSYEPDASTSHAQLNAREEWGGNITAVNVEYGAAAEATSYHHEYGYDALSRLISASTVQGPGNDASCQEDYAYDDHTNLVNYNRTGAGLKLKTFSYSGNRMTSVSLTSGTSGARGTVSYDDMGRITSSTIEGMAEVKYNVVGYPSYVRQADGGYVHHTYTAGGARLASRRVIPGDVDEVTLMEYEGNEVRENGQLRMLLFDGGYVDFSGSEPRYCWHTTDHLGSVRAVADSLGNVFASYAYRPYGEEFVVGNLACDNSPAEDQQTVHEGEIGTGKPHPIEGGLTEHYSANASSDWQPYRFSGKESLTRVGLDLYDFGARMYSPSNMRWMTMDPLCEKFYDISPYVYCNGNPIRFVDPDGRTPIFAPGYAIYEAARWALLGIAAYYSAETVVEYASNNDYGAGKRWQDQQEGKARDDYNRRRINMQKSINNNFPDDNDPNRSPRHSYNGPLKGVLLLLELIDENKGFIYSFFSQEDEQQPTSSDNTTNGEERSPDSNNESETNTEKPEYDWSIPWVEYCKIKYE